MESATLVNRVAGSSLVTVDLEKWYPAQDIQSFDLKDFLFMGLILKEKDFREALNNTDWEVYRGKILAVYCSADAIIPMWAYMLVAAHAAPIAEEVLFCAPEKAIEMYYLKKIATLDVKNFEGRRVVVKGCSDRPVPAVAYLEMAYRLTPVVQSLMFGEPCSTVPVFKKKT